MKAELIDTTASTVRNELTRMCQKMGGLTTGVVLNLIIMTDEADQYDAMRAATHAGREHPCQILGVIARAGRRRGVWTPRSPSARTCLARPCCCGSRES